MAQQRLPTSTHFRYRDARARGFTAYQLERSVERGEIERIGRGLYRRTGTELDPMESVASVAAAVPGAIVCLLTALAVHGIGTQAPHEVWIALDRKRRKPVSVPVRVRIVRSSGRMLEVGIDTHRMGGTNVRITGPARTVVDCLRYRNKIGTDVAMEALRDVLHTRKASVGEILRIADACRARTVVRPYLEAIVG
jgi:predicted transcriptional regulator of viral defense system